MHGLALLLVWLIILIAVVAVGYWFFRKATIPEPFNYIIYAIIAIVCIYILLQLPGLLEGASLRIGSLAIAPPWRA